MVNVLAKAANHCFDLVLDVEAFQPGLKAIY